MTEEHEHVEESCCEAVEKAAASTPPPPPFVRFWYLSDGLEVEGPLAEPKLLERVAAGEVSSEALVCRADDGWWHRVGSIPFFYSLALRGAQARKPQLPERPVPGLSPIRWPRWPWLLALVALGAAVVLGVHTAWYAPAGYRPAEPFATLLVGGRLAVAIWVGWAMLTSRPVAIGRMIAAALWIVGLGLVAQEINPKLLAVVVVDAAVGLALVVAAWRLSSALAAHQRKVRLEAEAYARELQPRPRMSWWWIAAAIAAGVALVMVVIVLMLTLVGIAVT